MDSKDKYVEELTRLMDVLIVRYKGEHKRYPSGYVRNKLRTQVVDFLAERFPHETAIYRSYLAWMYNTLSGTFRSIRNDEVPEHQRVGHEINNSMRGKLSALARYRNTGLAAFSRDRSDSEERKYQHRLELLNGATEGMEAYEKTLPTHVTASDKAIRGGTMDELDLNIAIRRHQLAAQYCMENAHLLPSDEVTGLLMGLSPVVVEAYRKGIADRVNFDPYASGFWVTPLPQKTLLEQLMEKLGTMDKDELAALADLFLSVTGLLLSMLIVNLIPSWA